MPFSEDLKKPDQMVSGSPIVSDLYYEEIWDQAICFQKEEIVAEISLKISQNIVERFHEISLNDFTKYR